MKLNGIFCWMLFVCTFFAWHTKVKLTPKECIPLFLSHTLAHKTYTHTYSHTKHTNHVKHCQDIMDAKNAYWLFCFPNRIFTLLVNICFTIRFLPAIVNINYINPVFWKWLPYLFSLDLYLYLNYCTYVNGFCVHWEKLNTVIRKNAQ